MNSSKSGGIHGVQDDKDSLLNEKLSDLVERINEISAVIPSLEASLHN